MIERFNPDARQVLAAAEREARLLKHGSVATEHLLLGLLKVDCVGGRALQLLGVTHRKARRRVVRLVDVGAVRVEPPLHFTPRSREVIEDAFTGAQWQQKLGETFVGNAVGPRPRPRALPRVSSEQLAFALVAPGEGVASHVLHELGVDLEKLAIAVMSARTPALQMQPMTFQAPRFLPPPPA